jgi:hypothetical protein
MPVPYEVQHAREETMDELMHKHTLTVEEVCEIYGFPAQIITHAAWSGELKATIMNHHIYGIRRDDLIHWLKERAGI